MRRDVKGLISRIAVAAAGAALGAATAMWEMNLLTSRRISAASE